MNSLSQDHFTRLFNKLYSQAHTGASVNINNLNDAPKTGYMVSICPVKVYDTIQDVKTGEVIDAVKFNHNGSNKNYLGIWSDKTTGKCYIDISQWCNEKNEAISKGKELGEIAIWDLSKNEEIRL